MNCTYVGVSMIIKHWRYLVVLWSFIILSFVLFQNFNQELDKVTIHNEQCKQALDINQNRISQINNNQSALLSVWPNEDKNEISNATKSLTFLLIETNQKLFGYCKSDNKIIQESHIKALNELKKLTDIEINPVAKEYYSLLDSSLIKIKELQK